MAHRRDELHGRCRREWGQAVWLAAPFRIRSASREAAPAPSLSPRRRKAFWPRAGRTPRWSPRPAAARWTGVSNNTTWISVTGGSSGTGNGTVSYTVAANTSSTPRTGTLTIAGVTVTVTQAGACNFTVAPTTQNVLARARRTPRRSPRPAGCGWTGASNNTTWITVTSGSSGTGPGTVNYNVAANTSTSPRTGTLTIAGHTVTVTQAGACNFTVAPTTQNVVAAGASHSAAVTTTSRLRLDRRRATTRRG